MLGDDHQLREFLTIFDKGSKLTYQKGEYIIRPGEVPSAVFFIVSGLVKAFDISKYGEENLLVIRKPNEIFPLIWALTGEDRGVIYQALDTTTVFKISSQDFRESLKQNHDFIYPLLDLIILQYKMHSERILNLEYRTVRERLVSFLLTMSDRFPQQTKDEWLINVPLKHQDIASSINSSRETTSREMGILERRGLVSSNQSFITLKDKAALKKLL